MLHTKKKKMPPWKPNLVQVIGNVARVYAIRLATNDFFLSLVFCFFFVCLFQWICLFFEIIYYS